jgi:hypothetical protein
MSTVARLAPVALLILTSTAAAQPETGGPFDRRLALRGISFHVSCPNDGPRPTLTITPAGLQIDNTPIVREVDGPVVGAEVADLDADGSPEIYVYTRASSAPPRTTLVAFAANRRKSLSDIVLPTVDAGTMGGKGFRGGDELRLAGRRLVRRFPVYRDGDADGAPTGGAREIQYVLARGEASWVLRPVRVTERPR